MTSGQFRVVVANALSQGWLGLEQTAWIWQQIDQLQAMQLTLRALMQRISERKAYRLHGQIELSREEVEQEFAKQLRIIDREATRSIDERLKAKDLSPDIREFLTEGLAELRASQRR